MKWLIIGVIIVIVILLYTRCRTSNNNIQYNSKNNEKLYFVFKFQPGDSLDQTISLITRPVKKNSNELMFLQTEFKGQRKDAEKVLSVNLKLYAKNANTGLYDEEVIINNTYAHVSFTSQYYYVYGIGEKNYTGNLNKLINIRNENNPEDRINNLYIDNELILKEYPQEIKAIIHVKWIGGEREFVCFLTLKESKAGSKVRTNPFG